MKRSFFSAGVVLAVAFAVQPAMSADLASRPYKAPVEAAPSWTGFYVGAGIGGAAGTYDLSGGTFPNFGNASAELDGLGAQGFVFGLNAGYDYQFAPQFVIGAFFDYDWHTEGVKASFNVPAAANGTAKADVNGQWSVGARLGYLSSPTTLWYVSGGYTNLSIDDLSVSGNIGAFNLSTAVGIPDFDGWFVGFGAESKLTNNISIKGEYRYSSFDKKGLDLPTVAGVNLNNFAWADLEPTVQTFKISVNYRFNTW